MQAAQNTVRQLLHNGEKAAENVNNVGGKRGDMQNVPEAMHAREPNETTIMKARPTTSVRAATKSHNFNATQQMGATSGSFKFGNRQLYSKNGGAEQQLQQQL